MSSARHLTTHRAWLAVGLSLGITSIFAMACSFGDKGTEEKRSSSRTSERLVSAQAILQESAALVQEIDSFAGTFSMEVSTDDQKFSTHGVMNFRAPDTIFMTYDVLDEELELVAYGADFYVKIPEKGWYEVDIGDFGINKEAFARLYENRGVIDFGALTDNAVDIVELPDEEIDRVSYQHFRFNADFAQLVDDNTLGLLEAEAIERLEDAQGTTQSEFWIDRTSGLPRRAILEVHFDLLGKTNSMEMTMDFLEFDLAVDIPERPKDAPPISELQRP